MSSNRVQYFIRHILQNSKLNREKFVKNKKMYTNKNSYNLIVKRTYSSSQFHLPPPNNNNNNNNNFGFILLAALSVYSIREIKK